MLRFRSAATFVTILVCACAFSVTAVEAADSREEAKTAYAAASHAFEAGDFVTASRELARADELAPNDVVLSSALDAVLKTDDALLGMSLVERASLRGAALATKAEVVRSKFSSRVGRLGAFCEPDSACEISIDGVHAPEGKMRYVTPGTHRVVATGYGAVHEENVTVLAGEEKKAVYLNQAPPAVAPTPPPAPPEKAPPPASTGGVSPVWFWVGAGVSAALAAGTVVSYVDTANLHDEFLASRTQDLRSSGIAAQTRTGVLLGLTGAAVVTTAAVGLFAVRWHSGAELRAQAGYGTASIAVRF